MLDGDDHGVLGADGYFSRSCCWAAALWAKSMVARMGHAARARLGRERTDATCMKILRVKTVVYARAGDYLRSSFGKLLFYLRADCFFGAEEDLETDVGDPVGLAVGGCDGLEASATHQHEEEVFRLLRATATEPRGWFRAAWFGRWRTARRRAGGDGVCVLLVVEFEVRLGAVGELVADEEAADPALGTV